MEFLIITGLSGAGKNRAAEVCEDLGYYCVDNLPAALLSRFAALCLATRGRYERVALVLDARSVAQSDELEKAMDELDSMDCQVRLLYLEAEMRTLQHRYKESRRPHPLGEPGMNLAQAVERERQFLAPLRARADFIISTDSLSLNGLKAKICLFLGQAEKPFSVTVESFGYKRGLPPEADLVFDVRCLPNPYYEPELTERTGLEPAVAEYVFRNGHAQALLDKLVDLLTMLLPLYESDRRELTIAVGCTGGRHRSVVMAVRLAEALQNMASVTVVHRELE